jgi:hypothetical protein
MSRGATRLAFLAGGSVIAFAVTIWLMAREPDTFGPPEAMSRALISAVLLGAPGVVGSIGAATGRRTVVIAAGVLCLLQAGISFSGVTLLYLVPAIAFLRAGTEPLGTTATQRFRPLRVVLAVVLALPVALFVVYSIGLLGVLILAVVAGLASARQPDGRASPLAAGDAARGAAIVLLVIGAWIATFALAETVCWVGREAPSGEIAWERIPPTNTLTLELGEVAAICSGGTPTDLGVAVAGMLALVAFAVAANPTRTGRGLRGEGRPGMAAAKD